MALSTKTIQALEAGKWLSDGGARGAGTLAFRRAPSGEVLSYFRYTTSEGKREAIALGRYSETGRNGLKLAELRNKAGELSRLYLSGIRDLRAHFEALRVASEVAQAADEQARHAEQEARTAAARYTLSSLCRDYAQHLENGGKAESARQARSLFKVWIDSNADLATAPAKAVTAHMVAAAIRKPREAGKERTAGVLRAYLLAAFNAARRAPFDSSLPAALIAYGVETNPCEIVPAIPVSAGDRTLTEDELRAYIAALGDTVIDRALKVALYAGGQRISQLLRATLSDFDNNTLRLWDGKGRRRTAREHALPLAPVAASLVSQLAGERKEWEALQAERDERAPNYADLPIFSARQGEPIAATSIGRRIQEISKQIGGAPFDARDIRRTVETLMAGMRISKDLRAQLLSHGLGGVQDQHYDRHSYTDEKRAALCAWESRLAQIVSGKEPSNVIELHQAAA